VFKVPAQALRDRDTIWIVSEKLDPDSVTGALELQVRRVQIAHLDQDNVFISKGIKPGERIIISPIKGAANGLKIRIAGNSKKSGKQIIDGNKNKWQGHEGKRKRPEGQGNRPESGTKDSRNKRAEQNEEAHKESQ
jgi:hypothetical protein